MAEYDINLSSDQAKGLLTSGEGLKDLVEAVRVKETPLYCPNPLVQNYAL